MRFVIKLIPFFMLLVLTACGTMPNESAPVAKWIGEKGYFIRPAEISETDAGEFFSAKDYKACSKSTIKKIKTTNDKGDTAEFDLVIEQKDKKFLITRINRTEILGFEKDQYKLKSLEKYFRKGLPGKRKKKILVKEVGKVLSTRKMMCNGLIWSNMTKSEFLFVMGRPNKIKLPSSAREELEDWYYFYSEDPAENKRFRFRKGKLNFWKNINPERKNQAI